MKRILWCGGSHLAHARPHIEASHATALKAYEPDFYVTAGPRNRDWSGTGGRYRVDGAMVSGTANEPARKVDMSANLALVFIGQFFQPFKAVLGDMDHASTVVERVLQDLPMQGYFHDPARNIEQRWYNEPLSLFPPLVPGPTLILPDPAPIGMRYAQVPTKLKQRFSDQIRTFCTERGLILIDIPQRLCTSEGTTKAEYALPGDVLHMNDSYWKAVFDDAVLPTLLASLDKRSG